MQLENVQSHCSAVLLRCSPHSSFSFAVKLGTIKDAVGERSVTLQRSSSQMLSTLIVFAALHHYSTFVAETLALLINHYYEVLFHIRQGLSQFDLLKILSYQFEIIVINHATDFEYIGWLLYGVLYGRFV
ncbi:hypothetical protein Tcan_12643 [Toxocara canis]|uniref:Uncharacterized protein n=1 Tax=Toxocara canis TaxID=6265 RepID=A0A0B2VFP6_TOXCA|nr:hypothetical protein Tcan_12643 [Toxocara canis]